jgi:hypothetical protein
MLKVEAGMVLSTRGAGQLLLGRKTDVDHLAVDSPHLEGNLIALSSLTNKMEVILYTRRPAWLRKWA